MNAFTTLQQNEGILFGADVGEDVEKSTGNFYGIGLSNGRGITETVPFDLIGLVSSAELVRRRLDLDKCTVLIADDHAKTNGSSDVDRVGKDRKALLERVIDRAYFSSEVLLASEVSNNPNYQEILPSIHVGNDYERQQLADMEWFRRRGQTVKIGWANARMDFDERHFDQLYKSVFGNLLTFVYSRAGKALDGTPLPPYLTSEKERLLLKVDEDIDYKIDQTPKKVRAYFSQLLDTFNELVYGTRIEQRNDAEELKSRLKDAYLFLLGDRT